MNLIHKMLILLFGVAISLKAVPPVLNYAGQVAVNGEAFEGNGLFKFALVNADGTTTYWSNDGTSVDGSEPQVSVAVVVNGGLYSILLGNTAQQGMGAIDPAVFTQHTDAKLRVWFSDGVNGFQQLSPDRPFASVPYAFSAGTAQTAGSAPIANGAVNLDMLSQDVKTQINAPISRSRLSQEVLTDINATIGMNRLSTEVTEKLNQEKTTNNYNAPSVGSLLAVPYGSDAPSGYSLYQRGEPRLVWEEKAPVSVARHAYDGVEVLDGKIYFVGGWNGSAKNIAEMYEPETDTWETLAPMSVPRNGGAYSVLNSKLYAIAGANSTSVEIFDSSTGNWANSVNLAERNNFGSAITTNGKIYLIGGSNGSGKINKVLSFDPTSNEWSAKTNMPTARDGHKLVWFENRIWAIGGNVGSPSNKVESYDPHTDSWQTEASLTSAKDKMTAWVANDKIYVGGGRIDASQYLKSIEVYDPTTKQWSDAGNLPENKYSADSVVLNDQVYVIAGQTASGVYSDKVYAADLNASLEGVYDLYRKDGDAHVGSPVVQSEYADGSVTGSKMADGAVTTDKLNEQILKYLKPEITAQPQAKIVYSYSNASYSVTAEGKYLTYQWKKDGVDLAGETNATLNITDANATLHDGNYSVVVSNDFGSKESEEVEVKVFDSLQNGLFAWYPLDQNASDMSGNGNDGTPQNTPEFVTNNGKSYVTLQGSGVSTSNGDHILLPHNSFTNLTKISISGWINFESNSYDQNDWAGLIILGEYYSGRFSIYVRSGGGTISFGQKIGEFLLETENGWNSFTVTSNEESTKLYYNGELKNLSSDPYAGFSGSVAAIGRHWWSGSTATRLNGSIDDVRIYDRALSSEEVQALHNLGQ